MLGIAEYGGAAVVGLAAAGGGAYGFLTRRQRELMREWVVPLHQALARPLGVPEQTDPRRYLHVPLDFMDDDAQIRVDVPAHRAVRRAGGGGADREEAGSGAGVRLAGYVGAIDLRKVGLDLAGGQALRSERDDHLVHAGQTLLPLLDDPRLQAAFPVAGHGYPDRADVGEHGLGTGAVA
ncbi:hypothetical protein J2S52_005551 [Streptomyces sp. DSM 41037]|nr:hypothetical protein [Streptomyces sp. DSM 41037]